MRLFLHLKIRKQFTGFLTPALLFIVFCLPARAQKVGPIKITPANAGSYRDSLTLRIFGSIDFPYDILPQAVATNVNTIDHYPGFPYGSILYPAGNLDSIDRFSVYPADNLLDFPEPVQSYLFHPHNSNGKLFIYHSGHCAGAATIEDIGDNAGGTEPGLVIPGLIAAGYTVLAVPMLNYQLPYPLGLSCGYNNHDALFLDDFYEYPLALFFKPLIASLNFAGRSNYSDIYMCGLSGGGWTTSVYPALDSSVTCSFPVSGSWPSPVASYFQAGSDYEQYYPPVFRYLLDYHELYTLSCLAPARKMLQINNRYDACCFDGATAHLYYVDSVAQALQGSAGVFKFYLDETETGHQISQRALDIMLTFIRNDTAFLQNKPIDSVTSGTAYSYNIKNNFSVTVPPINPTLQYSLLKGPAWLTLDAGTGLLTGTVPQGDIISKPDSISFKVEDQTGRFVLYNYNLIKKREAPYFFTTFDNSTLYFLPQYRNSISMANPLIIPSFYFNNPALTILDISIENNSVIKLKLNNNVSSTDSIGYSGFSSSYALAYNSGMKLEDFGLSPIRPGAATKYYAITGMIRFNSETVKFEFFNGTTWINMN